MEDLANMSLEQRRELYKGALESLGVVMGTLRYTGWNPFADDAPTVSSFDQNAMGAHRMGSFVDDETGFAIEGAYYYQAVRNAQGLLPGEYKYMHVEDGDGIRAIDLCDIRKADGGRVQYIAFDSQTAAFVSASEVEDHSIRGVFDTYYSSDADHNKARQIAIGTEINPDGNIELFIQFEHIRYETEEMLAKAYRINLKDYMEGNIPESSLFGLSGTQDMIASIAEIVPEMFLNDNRIGQGKTTQVGEGHGFGLYETTTDLPGGTAANEGRIPATVTGGLSGGSVRSIDRPDEPSMPIDPAIRHEWSPRAGAHRPHTRGIERPYYESLKDKDWRAISYLLDCKRFQDVASQIVALVQEGNVTDSTGFDEDELEDRIRTGWVVVYEHEQGIELLPFKVHDHDRVVLMERVAGINNDDDIVANLSRARLWVQRGRYDDLRMDTPAEINPEQLYDLLKRGYIDPVTVMDKIVDSVSPIPRMNSEMRLDMISKGIRFGLNSGILKAELVEGKFGMEYRFTEPRVTDPDLVVNEAIGRARDRSSWKLPAPIGPGMKVSPPITALRNRVSSYTGQDHMGTMGRLPINGSEPLERPGLQSISRKDLEERGVSVDALGKRIGSIIDKFTIGTLEELGMWGTTLLEDQNIVLESGKVIQIASHTQGSLNVNTAIVNCIKGVEGIVGVLTDVDTTDGEEIRTMVVDFRRVNTGGETKLIVTCLEKVLPRNNIKLPTTDDGGFVFELVFDEPDPKLEPAIVMRALQALDLTSGDTGPGYKINRYILSQSHAGNRSNS